MCSPALYGGGAPQPQPGYESPANAFYETPDGRLSRTPAADQFMPAPQAGYAQSDPHMVYSPVGVADMEAATRNRWIANGGYGARRPPRPMGQR